MEDSSEKKTEQEYQALLESFANTHPLLAASLLKAQKNRIDRLQKYSSGVRLKGLEQLQSHLIIVEQSFQRNRTLKKVAFLIARAKADFETALEAVLSGLHGVVFDAMRDVMEVEFLLRDFLYESSHIDDG
ncbi:MAG TPA: hypothetical protein VGC87_11695 [Pyrinomonadaceae bacterium]|jgi:hypothetical protein